MKIKANIFKESVSAELLWYISARTIFLSNYDLSLFTWHECLPTKARLYLYSVGVKMPWWTSIPRPTFKYESALFSRIECFRPRQTHSKNPYAVSYYSIFCKKNTSIEILFVVNCMSRMLVDKSKMMRILCWSLNILMNFNA